jgi:hypothetical protein
MQTAQISTTNNSDQHYYKKLQQAKTIQRYFFFQAASQLYSRGWVDPVPDPTTSKKIW